MRKTLLLLSVLFLSINAYCQKDYYWSNNKKNYLTVDSSTVIVKTIAATDKENATALLKNTAGVNILLNHFDSVRQVVKYSKKVFLSDVMTSLTKKNVKVAELAYGHFYEKEPFIITGVIVFEPKAGVKMADVIAYVGKDVIEKANTDEFHISHITPVHLKDVFTIANKLYESGLVKFSHPDFIEKAIPSVGVTNGAASPVPLKAPKRLASSLGTPDPYYANQYYLKNTGQTGGTYGVDINVEPAWTVPLSSTAARVAVIDQGGEAHEDLNPRMLQGYTPRSATGYGLPVGTGNGHGESCAGIIAATGDNGLDIKGVCPTALIIPINIYYGGETSQDFANAFTWAYQSTGGNADVISCSNTFTTPADVINTAITNARTLGRGGKGTVVICSAGNYIPNNVAIGYPASVSGVIAMGAIDKNGNRWNYSPNSPTLVAPSGDVNLAGDVYTLDRMGANGFNAGNYMSNFGGTSAACPEAAGVAALIISVNPGVTESIVRTSIINGATSMGYPTSFGSGRLNAYGALQASIPHITGTTAFCNSSVLTCTPIPPGGSVVWAISPGGVVSISPSGATCTVTKITQGFPTISATVSGPGITTSTATLNLSTYPSLSALSATMSGSCTNYYQTWYVSPTPNMAGATNWHWTVNGTPNGVINIQNPYSQNTYVSVTGGGGIAVTYTDQCGETSHTDGVTIYSPCGKAPAAIVAYPNPAGNQLTIQNNTPSSVTYADGTVANIQAVPGFSVELYNAQGTVIKSGQNTGGSKNVVLNTADIANGTYYLHVKQGSELIEKQIIIKH